MKIHIIYNNVLSLLLLMKTHIIYNNVLSLLLLMKPHIIYNNVVVTAPVDENTYYLQQRVVTAPVDENTYYLQTMCCHCSCWWKYILFTTMCCHYSRTFLLAELCVTFIYHRVGLKHNINYETLLKLLLVLRLKWYHLRFQQFGEKGIDKAKDYNWRNRETCNTNKKQKKKTEKNPSKM